MRRLKPSFITALLAVGLCGHGCDRVKELKDSLLGKSTAESDVNPALAEIENLYASGQYDQTLRKIEEATSADPNLTEAYYYRGLCYLALAEAPDVKGPLSRKKCGASKPSGAPCPRTRATRHPTSVLGTSTSAGCPRGFAARTPTTLKIRPS